MAASAAIVRQPPRGPPIVIQCDNCRAVLGDTTLFVCAHAGLKAISLSGACRVSVEAGQARPAAAAAPDAGCHFHLLLCQSCGSTVGRMYTTTTAGLEALRGALTFDTAATCSHELGTVELRMQRPPHTHNDGGLEPTLAALLGLPSRAGLGGYAPPGTDDDLSVGPGDRPAGAAAVARRLESIDVQLLKIEQLLLVFSERLDSLERPSAPPGAGLTLGESGAGLESGAGPGPVGGAGGWAAGGARAVRGRGRGGGGGVARGAPRPRGRPRGSAKARAAAMDSP